MTGRVLNDRQPVMAGTLPGWMDNRRFADKLIDLVTSYIRDRNPYSATKLYELFANLEARLGQLIQSVLVAYCQNGDFSALIPQSVRKKVVSGKFSKSR